MPIDREPTASCAWQSQAAYFYTLDLDGPALAWEYLRRNPDYRADWAVRSRRRCAATAGRWGLRFRGGPGARRAQRGSAVAGRH